MATLPSTQEAELKIRKDQIIKYFTGNSNAVLDNPTARVYFYEFLKSEHNGATVNFLNQMEYLCLIYGDQVEGRDKLDIFDLPLIQQLRMIYQSSIFCQQGEHETFSGKAPENVSSVLREMADEYYLKVLGKEEIDVKFTDEEAMLAANAIQIKEYNKNASAFYQKFDLKNKTLLNGKSLFGAVHDEVLGMLCNDAFPRFPNSQPFKDLVEVLANQKIAIEQLKVIPPRIYDLTKGLRTNMKNYLDTVAKYKKKHEGSSKAKTLLGTLPDTSSVQNFFKFLPSIGDTTVAQKMENFSKALLELQKKLTADKDTFSNIAALFSKICSILSSITSVFLKGKSLFPKPTDPSRRSSSPFVPKFDSLQLTQGSGSKSRSKSVNVPDVDPSAEKSTAKPPPLHNVPRTGSRTLQKHSKRLPKILHDVTDQMTKKFQDASAAAQEATSLQETSPIATVSGATISGATVSGATDSSSAIKKPDSSPNGP